MTSCYGPVSDRIDGSPYCPYVPDSEPDAGQTWEEYCRECVEGRERHAELVGDCARDEA